MDAARGVDLVTGERRAEDGQETDGGGEDLHVARSNHRIEIWGRINGL